MVLLSLIALVLLPSIEGRNAPWQGPQWYNYHEYQVGNDAAPKDDFNKNKYYPDGTYYHPLIDGKPIVLPDFSPVKNYDDLKPKSDVSKNTETKDETKPKNEKNQPPSYSGTKPKDDKSNSKPAKQTQNKEYKPAVENYVSSTTEKVLPSNSKAKSSTKNHYPVKVTSESVFEDDCDCEDESEDDFFKEKDLDQELMARNFIDTVDQKFRALVFNPAAQPHDKFQSCVTPLNETGSCKYIQHCLISSVISSIDNFMNYVCIINDRFIGVCCPDFPVTLVNVKWDDVPKDDSPVASQEECGISTKTRIVGGSKSDPKEWPWMAALLTMKSGQFYCGGSLINNRYVLTAAHCTFRIPQDQILVRLGEYDFSVQDQESPGEDIPVVQIKRHGQYSRRTLHNDIALLKLARPVKFSNSISTICMPSNKSFDGETATLAGWGNVQGGGPTSDVLLEVALPVVKNQDCSRDHGITVPEDTFICTKSKDPKGACNGDSGGPLMRIDDSKHWEVIGVVSWGRRGCDPKFPTVYSRVTHYLDWIKAHST